MRTEENNQERLARSIAAALFLALLVWLALNSIEEPAQFFEDCDTSVTDSCCYAAFGNSRLHEIYLEVIPGCILSAVALALAVLRKNSIKVTLLSFVGVGAAIGFMS